MSAQHTPGPTADALHSTIRAREAERMSLLDKAGRTPREGTEKADRYEALTIEIDSLIDEWAKVDRAGRAAA